MYRSRVLWRTIAAVYTILIFYLSSMPDSSLNLGISPREKLLWNIAHIPFYAVLALLLSFGFHDSWKVVILCLIVALFDEWNQASIPGRSASLADLTFDCIGIFSIVLLRKTSKMRKFQIR